MSPYPLRLVFDGSMELYSIEVPVDDEWSEILNNLPPRLHWRGWPAEVGKANSAERRHRLSDSVTQRPLGRNGAQFPVTAFRRGEHLGEEEHVRALG